MGNKAAAFPELSLMQQWWHRWLGCGISMGVAGDALWQAAMMPCRSCRNH
ncbi:MAG: hypothetical protein ACLR5S_10130 [Ruminococcus sp.]